MNLGLIKPIGLSDISQSSENHQEVVTELNE